MNKAKKRSGRGTGGTDRDSAHKIGFTGAVGIIVGTVIGSGIYIMIGPLAAATGPGLFLCYLFALVIAVTASVCYAQVASVFPATAATYRYVKMFYNDFTAFLIGWFRLVGSFCGLALMSSGFADYVSGYSSLDSRIVAVAVLTVLLIVNLLGIRTTQRVVQALVMIVIAGLLTFCSIGVFKVRPENLMPLWGPGMGSVLKGSLTAFYAYTGLYIVAEVGDEVQDAQKTIPRSIFAAAVIVGSLYLGTTIVFAGGLGWDTIREHVPNLAQASKLLLGPRAAALVQFSAITAIMAPMNASYMASSRSLYGMAADGLMPSAFARLNRYKVPGPATITVYIPAVLIVMLDPPILFLGTVSSIVILSGMALVAGACLTIKDRYPEEFEGAAFKMSDTGLKLLPAFTIISAVLLTIVSLVEDPLILYSFGFWLLAGGGCYYARKYAKGRSGQLKREG